MNTDTKIEKIPINLLLFDQQNPRLPSSYQKISDENTIINWMLQNANLVELLGSIASQGFFDGEPILVYENNEDKYVVVEGNRRLAAIKLLNNPEIALTHKKKVKSLAETAKKPIDTELPVIIYSCREDILDYLGFRHITGVQSWGALAKAKYLRQLRSMLVQENPDLKEDYRSQFAHLANDIGTNSNYVARLLTGLKLYDAIEDNDYFKIPSLNEDSINFSLLTTALSYSNINNYISLESPKDIEANNLKLDKLKDLCSWLYEKNDEGLTRLGESRNLKLLSSIVANPDALNKFKSKSASIHEASLLTEHPTEIVDKAIEKSINSLKTANEYVPFIERSNSNQLDELKKIAQITKAIYKLLDEKLYKDDSSIFDL